ncbi:MAG: hypothetical protein J7K31_00725 [Candidatus Aenigmarchaeota archaeon]|nr:hypothetical protein [Candidatus Aenigmarchaeota archaeon]RLI97375.1 MAG: hypothetical protein DRO96_00835 [Candidatus Aenigmarchaeota archaeon]
MKLVIKVGGSLAIGPEGPRGDYIRKLISVINEIAQNNQLVIGIGGGGMTRQYAKAIESFGLTDEQKEEMFIDIMRSNVRLLSFLLKGKPVFSLEDLNEKEKIQTIGGIAPGRSSDANAALAAEKIRADLFIILTDVDGIYEEDPKKNKNAKKIDVIPFDELEKFAIEGSPNNYGVVDPVAIKVIQRSKIPTIVCDGHDPRIILKILNGERVGTRIE